MFSQRLIDMATRVLAELRAKDLMLATAESCTGGLIAALLTDVPGASHNFDRGFVTYSNHAKHDMLGVAKAVLISSGAVSEPVARAMAQGVLTHSRADVAVAVTGVAGPGGGTPQKPVGLVHIAAARKGRAVLHEAHQFGDIGRDEVRFKSVEAALNLLRKLL